MRPGAPTKLSLYTRACGRKLISDRKYVLPAADPGEVRREAALIKETAARLILTRHRVDQMRDGLVERDRQQAEIGAATVEVSEELACAQLEADILAVIGDDLGDLTLEALRVTR